VDPDGDGRIEVTVTLAAGPDGSSPCGAFMLVTYGPDAVPAGEDPCALVSNGAGDRMGGRYAEVAGPPDPDDSMPLSVPVQSTIPWTLWCCSAACAAGSRAVGHLTVDPRTDRVWTLP
jgi:hypothetical protein